MNLNPLLHHRILFLSAPISAASVNPIIAELLLLNAEAPGKQIDLYINSPGGSVLDGLALIDAMQCIEAPVSTICIGQAASMAAWVLAAGSRGLRFATPHAEILVHQVAADFEGQATDIQVHARHTLRLQSRLVAMLAQACGQSEEKVKKDMDRDFFMNAEEAKAYGLVDNVLEPAK